MTRKEAAGVIKFEKACVLRQDTPQCHRDCKKCDLLLPTEDVLTAYDMAIKALEQQPCEDAISRTDAIKRVSKCLKGVFVEYEDIARKMFSEDKVPSVQPKYNASEWCYDCKEYDKDKHCCHRWSKVIRNTVEEMKQEPVLDKVIAEIKGWYWQADKQALAKDPCVVDAMIDLFIRTIDKYKAESEDME